MFFHSEILHALILLKLCVGSIYSLAVAYSAIPDNLPSPEIWLRDYSSDIGPVDPARNKNQNDTVFRLQNGFHHDFIIRKDSSYIITKKFVSVTFICRAAYPVVWSVPDKKQLNGVSYTSFRSHTTRSSEFSGKLLNNKLFDSYISIDIQPRLVSLTLTCSSAKTEENASITLSKINLFNAASIYRIENEGETIQVYGPKLELQTDTDDTTTITLPCRPSNPNTSVVLERQLERTGIVNADGNQAKHKTWKEINTSESKVTFDSMVGFMIRVNSLEERNGIVGLFRCTVKTSAENHDAEISSTAQTTFDGTAHTEDLTEQSTFEEVSNTEIGFIEQTTPEETSNTEQTYNENERTESSFGYENLSEENYQPVVYFNVSLRKPTDLKENSTFERKLDLKGNAGVSIQQAHLIDPIPYPPLSEIVCCSGLSNKPPMIKYKSCKDHIQCQLVTSTIGESIDARRTFRSYPESFGYSSGASDCARVAVAYNAIVICKGDTMDVSEIYTNVFQNNITSVTNRTNEFESPLANSTNALRLQQYEAAANAQESHKAILTIGYPTTREHFLKNKQRKYLAFINAPNDRHFETVYNSKDKPVQSNSTIVGEYSRDFYYEGEPMVAVCLGWKYFHAEGARITVLWKNGTRTVVDEANSGKPKEKFMYFSKGVTTRCVDERELVHVFSKKFTALKDMASVECWLPQWNTDKWDKITRNVSIVDAIAPEFAEGEKEEVINLKLGDESGKDIECQVVKGAPEPKITLTKTGKWVIGRYNDNGEDDINNKVNITIGMNEAKVGAAVGGVTAKIQFGKVTQDMEGIYQCVAENFGGTDIRTFKVVVQ